MGARLAAVAAALAVIAVIVVLAAASAEGLAVATDADGWFASDAAGTGEVHPGPGVTLALRDPVTSRAMGRVTRGAAAPAVWTRDAAGMLTQVPLRAASAQAPLAAAVRAAVGASLAGAESATAKAFAERCGVAAGAEQAVLTDAAAPVTERAPVPPPRAGESLESWAPRECLFVRFRSVEAAYRFAAAADDLAGALLAVCDGDARDYGTLRLALHDLVLPAIWRTNPEAERGVSECALVVAPPFVRGRLSAALILRITDPELHRMQTTAGTALAAHADHLWRPDDDPFPSERDALNFRARPESAPDVEIVATSRALGERLVSRRSMPLSADARYAELRAASAGPEGRARTEEAAFAFSSFAGDDGLRAVAPPLFRSAARELREGLGLSWLARKWLGDAAASTSADRASHGPPPLLDVECVRVVTDERGAAVEVTARDEAAARGFAASLSALGGSAPAAARACATNLADLAPLARVERPDELAERAFVVLGWRPRCPCGGTYAAHPITGETSCSAHGSLRAPREAPFAGPKISGVTLHGAVLSFRLAIDWNQRW